MEKLINALIVLIVALPALSLADAGSDRDSNNGRIVSDAPWPSLPGWGELDDFTQGYFPRSVYEKARAQTDFEIRDIRYVSDGLTIRGMLIRPRNSGGKKWPAIIFNRGGTGTMAGSGTTKFPASRRATPAFTSWIY